MFFDDHLVLKDGRPTPYFVNFGMFRTGRLAMEMGSFFAGMMVDRGLARQADIILGPSYKGSAIAVATAISLYMGHGYDLFFEYDRKEVKAHGEGSKSASILVNRTLFDGCRVFLVDDVATTMRTKYELLERLRAETEAAGIAVEWTGLGIAVDREQSTAVYDKEGNVVPSVKGENTIKDFIAQTGIPVYAVAGISEIMEYLYREKVPVRIKGSHRPMDEETKKEFDDYLRVYGHDKS